MKPGAYYNEHDRYCAAWLRNLIAAGHIAAGDVDERDVRDVVPDDLRGYRQVHLFAGIGLWSLALRLAGWGDDRAVWTASCPCQPFSQAGAGGGIFDDRHLWPAAHWLIAQLRPVTVFGEQVAGADGTAWLDIVSSDLEAHRYTVGALAVCSAGLGAPNIRQRLYWVADAGGDRRDLERRAGGFEGGTRVGRHQSADGGDPRGQADADQQGEGGGRDHGSRQGAGAGARRPLQRSAGLRPAGGGLVDTESGGRGIDGLFGGADGGGEAAGQSALAGEAPVGGLGDASGEGLPDSGAPFLPGAGRWVQGRDVEPPSGAPASWREPQWVSCRDGVWRPFESGSFPLAPRRAGDVARLRAYGNAINPVVAAEVIRSFLFL